jgi:DNA-binding NtrC family response regulator
LYTLVQGYYFPGNIRELEGMVTDAVSRHNKGILSTQSFRDKMKGAKEQKSPAPMTLSPGKTVTFHGPMPRLKEMEKFLIDKALETANGNQTIAASLLGISRKALNNRLIRSK